MTCDRLIDLALVIIGAFLGIVGALASQVLRQKHERRGWHQDTLMRAASEVMGTVSRLALSLAYTPSHLQAVGWSEVGEQVLGLDGHLRVLGLLLDSEGESEVESLLTALAPLVIEYNQNPGAVSHEAREGLSARVEALRVALRRNLGVPER